MHITFWKIYKFDGKFFSFFFYLFIYYFNQSSLLLYFFVDILCENCSNMKMCCKIRRPRPRLWGWLKSEQYLEMVDHKDHGFLAHRRFLGSCLVSYRIITFIKTSPISLGVIDKEKIPQRAKVQLIDKLKLGGWGLYIITICCKPKYSIVPSFCPISSR